LRNQLDARARKVADLQLAIETVKMATMKGLGLGLLWRDHVKAEIKRGDVRTVKIPELKKMEAKTFIVYHKERPLSLNGQDFLNLLKRYVGSKHDGETARRPRRGHLRFS